jgi:hypothetical protein
VRWRTWMLRMCDVLIDEFYPRELAKIDKRIDRFRKLRQFWMQYR